MRKESAKRAKEVNFVSSYRLVGVTYCAHHTAVYDAQPRTEMSLCPCAPSFHVLCMWTILISPQEAAKEWLHAQLCPR